MQRMAAACRDYAFFWNFVFCVTNPQVTGNFLPCPGQDLNLGSGERQLAVSGDARCLRPHSHQGRPAEIMEFEINTLYIYIYIY